jgi:hypothetical protein
VFTLRVWAGVAALAALAGCSPKIGDSCTVSTDCSATGDRLCDITEPGGYCTIFNCEPDGCPDDAECINFGTQLSAVQGCSASQDNSPYQRSFCMASCKSDGDCRGGYNCVEPSVVFGVKSDTMRSNKICAVVPIASMVELNDAGTNNEVCLGSDAGPLSDTSSGGTTSSDAGGGAAGVSSGGMSGADTAGAGG